MSKKDIVTAKLVENLSDPHLIEEARQEGCTSEELIRMLKEGLQRSAEDWDRMSEKEARRVLYFFRKPFELFRDIAQEKRDRLKVLETKGLDAYLELFIPPKPPTYIFLTREPTRFITRYNQVREPVERTYETVTGHKLPDNIKISVHSLIPFIFFNIIHNRIPKISTHSRSHVGGLYIERFYGGECAFIDKKLKEEEYKGRIFVINNPFFLVVPTIFHEVGHADYGLGRKNRELDEIAAYLYKDELTLALSRHPEYSGLYDLYNSLTHPSPDHQKYADMARKLRSKTTSYSLKEKMGLLLAVNTPEELEKELAKY